MPAAGSIAALATSPSKIFVVALPMIFGAKMANSGAHDREHEHDDQRRHAAAAGSATSRRREPLKFFAFSTGAAHAHGPAAVAARPEPGPLRRGAARPAAPRALPAVAVPSLMPVPPRKAATRRSRGRPRRCRCSSRWVPMPTTRPSSRTMIRSASMTVLTRWATMITVASAVSFRSAARSRASVSEVQRGEAVVEDVDLGLPHEGPGNGQALLLPAGQVRAALGDHRLEAVRHGEDELQRLRGLRGVRHLLVGGVLPAVADVVGDGVVEQHRLLGDEAELAAQGLLRHLPDVHAVHEDAARSHVVEARDEVDERRLARAGAADDRGDLARARA